MNVVSFPTRAQIAKLIAAMDEDPEVRVIVIRGANGLYSSGGDIAGFLKVSRDGMHDLAWNVAAPERAKKPVIAAIEKASCLGRKSRSMLSLRSSNWYGSATG